MAPIELNFNPDNKAEMFHIQSERAEQMLDEINVVIRDIVSHYEDYKVAGTGKFEGCYRLHEGKALEELLTIAKNQNEWLFILFNANNTFDKIRILAKLERKNKIE